MDAFIKCLTTAAYAAAAERVWKCAYKVKMKVNGV